MASSRGAVFEFLRFLGRRVWTAQTADADRYLVWLRRDRQLSIGTIAYRAALLSQFYEFLLVRYQGDVHAVTGHVLAQPIDEFNRPAKPDHGIGRVPPSTASSR